jgi:hypothetical protein
MQFDAVNPDHTLPNVLVIVSHARGRARSDLHVVLTGIQVPNGRRLFTLKPKHQTQVWKAARRIDLIVWIDAQERTWNHACISGAPHSAMALELVGIEAEPAGDQTAAR